MHRTACFAVHGLATFEGAALDPARRALHTRAAVLRFRAAAFAAERCPCPVIAAVHGVTFGLGIELISGCDVRYAAADTRFAIKVRPAPLPVVATPTCALLSAACAGGQPRDHEHGAPAQDLGEPEHGVRAHADRARVQRG